MSRKTIKFNGFGFPVVLANVQTKVVHDEVVPDVNYNDLQALLFVALIRKPTRLSGAEIRFLRHHLEMTQDAFAKLLKIERSLVSKWEGKDLKATGMTIHAEIFLRMKLAKLGHHDLDAEFDRIEPGSASRGVGKPLEIKMGKAG